MVKIRLHDFFFFFIEDEVKIQCRIRMGVSDLQCDQNSGKRLNFISARQTAVGRAC